MTPALLLTPILIPVLLAIVIMVVPKGAKRAHAALFLTGTAAAFVFAAVLFGNDVSLSVPWFDLGAIKVSFSLRLYAFSGFIILAANALAFLIAVYSVVFMKGRGASKSFFAYMLLTIGFVNGAVLANDLILMLFFWEGLLGMLFAAIMTGGVKASATAVKALVLNGIADLCLMLGIGMLALSMNTTEMSGIHSAVNGSVSGMAAFILMMTGAIGKAGSMPFHSWIPDAASDAPLPFMAFMPGAIEKLLGIYLLTRVSLDLFEFTPGSAVSLVMMITGAATILLAVMMALIQKDFKRLLSYHAISQVGYMILGIGTALPIGIVGGLFHMVNNALYKSALYLTSGAVEYETGTSDLHGLGGLGRKMPITFACFLVTAASIAGVPPFNGFFSKELVFGAAKDANIVFYLVALLGAFFTAASFLKLGHAAFLGRPRKETENAKEAPWPMLVPMIIISAGCVVFGVCNSIPLKGFIEPVLCARLEGETFAGHFDLTLTCISLAVLLLAFLNHLYGVRKTKSGLGAVDHIHYAPGLKQIYGLAEKRRFDPYVIIMAAIGSLAKLMSGIDRFINRVYDGFIAGAIRIASLWVRKAHTGSLWLYILWIICGIAVVSAIVALSV
jgi:NADH:ubiquinone oxidoreductase subunit 5 (subunit L)/multisubunit Na+/H+ antiporter MnhA subunit